MNPTDRNYESASLLSIPISTASESFIARPAQATSALPQNSADAAGMTPSESRSSADQTLKDTAIPEEGSNPTSRSRERVPAMSGQVSALPDVSDITFDEDRLLDLELRPVPISNTDAYSTDKSFQALGISGHPSGWQRQARNKLGNWGWETGFCVCSLVAFAATVGLLKAFDGKSQPDWPYGITVNSATSLLTTMTKGFLLVPAAACISQSTWISYTVKSQTLDLLAVFDSASRGPWGAVQLLWTLKIRRLACMGALLTLLAVGIDPTVQQAIAIRTRQEDDVRQAHIPRAQSFVQLTYSGPRGSQHVPTALMAGSLYSGIFHGSSQAGRASLHVVPDCPTGNCTFSAYQTLAACFACEDVTDLLNTSCFEWSNDKSYIHQTCRFELPNSLHINQTMSGDKNQTAKVHSTFDGQTIAASTYLPLVKPTSHGPDVMRLTVINSTSWMGNMTTSASQCSIFWCVKTLEAELVNGRFSEHESDSWYDQDAEFVYEELPSNTLNIAAPFMGSQNTSSPYVVGAGAHSSLEHWLESSLAFSDSYAPFVDPTTGFHELGPDISNNFTLTFSTGLSISDYSVNMQLFNILRQVQIFGSTEMVSNLAKAITTYIRTLNANEQTYGMARSDFGSISFEDPFWDYEVTGIGPANGTAYTVQVCIHVRWAWISFTGVIVLLTIAFFALIVAQSERYGIAVWKSSPLALLFHGLEAEQMQHPDTDDVANMHFRAKNMRVRLRDTASGVKLENEQN